MSGVKRVFCYRASVRRIIHNNGVTVYLMGEEMWNFQDRDKFEKQRRNMSDAKRKNIRTEKINYRERVDANERT